MTLTALRRLCVIPAAFAGLLLCWSSASAQVRTPRTETTARVAPPGLLDSPSVGYDIAAPQPHLAQTPGDAPTSIPLMYVAALAGSATGLLVGGFTGYQLESRSTRHCGDSCGILGMMAGAWLGSSIGAATGAHLANDSRGSAPLGTVVTAGVTAAGIGLGMWISGAETSSAAGKLSLVAVPALQLHTAVRVELLTARRR